ncbi:MAG TPA: c-type cytochrome domain-containing protein [Pirellulales bacterium]
MRAIPITLCVVLSAAVTRADNPKITYAEHIQAIFREHCFTCHSQDTAKSDLSLDNYAAAMRGGASGEVIEPGDPDSSRLWALVSHTESPEMPPQQPKLADAKLALIKQWIAGGALENAGATAKIKKKPTIDLAVSAGSGKPTGPVAMPEGGKLSLQPIVTPSRPGAVTAIASSPWAPLLAVAGQKQIVLYHSDTAAMLGILPFPEGVAHTLKFSRTGALLLAGGGRGGKQGLAAVYDVKTGERVFTVGDELDCVLGADINNNHSLIALGGPRRVVRVYSAADGALVYELKKHTDWITAVEFSPDGVLLATGDRNGGLFVWEADTGREYQNLAGHTGGVTDVSWRDDSNVLVSASEDGTLRLWEMQNGTQVKNWGAHGGGALSVDFTHDGRMVSAGRDKTAKVWDANGGQVRAFEAFADLAMEATFTHDGARVAAGDWTGEIRLWDVADGKLISKLLSNPPKLEVAAGASAPAAATPPPAAQ